MGQTTSETSFDFDFESNISTWKQYWDSYIIDYMLKKYIVGYSFLLYVTKI